MNIKPSAAIRKDYNGISQLCKTTKQPVFLTKNGEGDLVVMDMETYARRESMLRLREQLLQAEEERLSGHPGYTIEEAAEMMRQAIEEVRNERQR